MNLSATKKKSNILMQSRITRSSPRDNYKQKKQKKQFAALPARKKGLTDAGRIRFLLESACTQGSDTAAEQIRQSILARMYDVSAFMKHLKQRFTTWYNRRHGLNGYFWEERFKSVLVDCPEHYR